jgi:hypothetical protein
MDPLLTLGSSGEQPNALQHTVLLVCAVSWVYQDITPSAVKGSSVTVHLFKNNEVPRENSTEKICWRTSPLNCRLALLCITPVISANCLTKWGKIYKTSLNSSLEATSPGNTQK